MLADILLSLHSGKSSQLESSPDSYVIYLECEPFRGFGVHEAAVLGGALGEQAPTGGPAAG